MKFYKAVSKDYTSNLGSIKWGIVGDNDWIEELPSGYGVVRAYHHPLLAAIFSPLYDHPYDDRLLEVQVKHPEERGAYVTSYFTKAINEVPFPEVTLEQRVCFAINCALSITDYEKFEKWGAKWISRTDRSVSAMNDASSIPSRRDIESTVITAAYQFGYGSDNRDLQENVINWAAITSAERVINSGGKSADLIRFAELSIEQMKQS